MRPIVELLAELRVAKVRVFAEGGQLRYQAPRGALTPDLLAELKARKADVLAFCQQAQAGQTQTDLPLEPIPRADDLPMSLAQQRLWVLNELEGPNASYNISLALRLGGRLNLAALKDGLAALLHRHEPLCTAFVARGGEVRAVIAPAVDLPWSQADLSHLPPESRLDEARQRANAEASRPFDLRVPPLVRFALWRLDEADHVLLINLHHIIADGGSIEILADEMATLYDAAAQGRAVALPPLRVQYADFAWHQRRWLAGSALQGQLDYWAKQLAGLPPLLELPADRPRPPVFAAAGACWRQRLDSDLVARLRQFAKRSGVSLNMLLLAGTALLLARYTNRDDIPLACPATHRDRPELERLVGFFINTLVLRFDLSGAPSFREVLRRTRAMMTDAFAHQDAPFDKLVEILRPERNPGYPPLAQVSVAMLDGEKAKLRLAGLDAAPFDLGGAAARYDLSLEIHDLGAELDVFWIYATALFEPATVARMGRHWEILLDAALAQPDAPAHRLPLLTDAEQAQLHAWNQTAADYPQGHTLASLFEAQVARTPDRVAVTFEGASLSYAQLNARANRVAHALMGWGVRANTLVGISVERSLELVVGLLGILKAGGAYVPLDPGNPPERLRFMLEDSRVAVLLTQSHLAWPAPETGARRLCLDAPDACADQPGHNPGPRSGPDDLAYVIYTSGSTGKPKGAMNAHRGICNRLLWMQAEYRLAADDRVLQKTPFSFDVSVWEFFWPLMVGARLVVAIPGGHQDPAYLSRTIDQEAITTLHFVPPMLRTFLDAASLPSAGTLRRIICSGEALPDDLQRTCLARLPRAGLHNLYGPTEAAVDVTYWPCRLDSPHHSVPIGRPVANTRIHILDRHLQPTPPGIPGELCIAGVQVGLGYLNRPELTAEKFLAVELFGQAERIYRTGDLARWLPDGNLEYLGRLDHQIKLRGFRIELGEIEAALCEHPDVREAVVTVWEDPPGNKRLVAYVVVVTSRSGTYSCPTLLDPGDGVGHEYMPDLPLTTRHSPLTTFLKDRLPDYMVPSAFVCLDALPLNPNGKVDRRALPAPQATRQAESVPPRDDTEAALADIWAGLLNLERIGVHDDFFDLGGHSLLAAQIMGRVRERFGVELPTRLMFEAGTIATLADAIAAARQAAREQAAAVLKARLDAMDPDQIRELLRQKRAQPAHAR